MNDYSDTAFVYDKTFDGLLTCIFDAYLLKIFPNRLLGNDEPVPLFCTANHIVTTDEQKASRVWTALEKKLSKSALHSLTVSWLADGTDNIDELIFRYIRKATDAKASIETNFGDNDVLQLTQVYKQVSHERLRMLQFLRFQKTADGIYFAAFEPLHNVLPLTLDHFSDRFSDQKWIIYDIRRQYGYMYDLKEVNRITFAADNKITQTGILDKSIMDADEQMFQSLWRTYYKSIAIESRRNPRKLRQDMPVRYWKHLTEKR